MKHEIPVECLIDRSWNPVTKVWEGTTVNGTLIDIVSQSAEDDFKKLIPAGIILTDEGKAESVPLEFISTVQ